MSRIVRQKRSSAMAKATKRRGSDSSSSFHLSDDDGYSGVEDISDSDDDEEHVYAAEEEHIISHALRQGVTGSSRPPNVNGDAENRDEEEADDDDADNEDGNDGDGNEAEEGADEDGNESVTWDGILSEIEDAASDFVSNYTFHPDVSHIERRVRFTGVPDSDSDSTTTEDTAKELDAFFPDIFVEQNALDPAFRREIEYDPDESSNSGSFWDFQSSQEQFGADSDEDMSRTVREDNTPTATPVASQLPSEASTPALADEVQDLDGYETDGDTTEEDIPEPPVRRKHVRRRSSVSASSGSDTERTVKSRRGQPRLGKYSLDHSDKKPIAVVNPISRKMMIFTPQRLRRLELSPGSLDLDYFTNPDIAQSSPILSNPASLMMSAMFSSNTFGDFMNTQPVGPAEAFFSFASDAVAADDSDETGVDDDEEDEEERNLKLEDFITFHHDSSEDEEPEGDDWDADAHTDLASTPIRPRTSASATSDVGTMQAHPLLSHFDNNADAVGAFRRNQINQQLILSDKASPASLAFSGPYHYGTLRGIKTGSMDAVSTPITPARRQKRTSVSGVGANDGNRSPLETVSQKRKASGALGESIHKRHRSISDMEILHL